VIALYQHDLTGRPLAETHALARVAADHAGELDIVIDHHSHGWTVERIAPLERSIMRVALAEMLHPEEVPADHAIPPEGAIEEAVETAKTFCSHEAPAFVNGVLAAALRELRDNVHSP
jgi:transcription antitermination protein NusB